MSYFNYISTDGKTTYTGRVSVSASMPAFHGNVRYEDPTAYLTALYGAGSVAYSETPFAAAPTKAELIGYATGRRDALLSNGITVNVGAAGGAPIPILCDGTVSSRSDLLTLYVLASSNPAFTADWTDNNNVETTLTAAEIVILSPAIMTWYQHMISALSAVISAINTGSITSTAAVDAYAWPTS